MDIQISDFCKGTNDFWKGLVSGNPFESMRFDLPGTAGLIHFQADGAPSCSGIPLERG
jgi:hypothetical protein